jgi:hypothetical protein
MVTQFLANQPRTIAQSYWLIKIAHKKIRTPTLSSNLWFAIPLDCKLFINYTGYNESIETLATTLAPSSVEIKEFALKYVCNSLDNNSRIALLTSSTSIFWGRECCVA